MKVNKAYKFRLYPTKSQIKYIEGCFNACRYVYNTSLDCENQLYTLGARSNLSAFGLAYHLKYYKKSEHWLSDYDSMALEFEMANLSEAFTKFFNNIKKKIPFNKAGYPKFKSKNDSKQSFRTRQKISVSEKGIKIPKLKKEIKTIIHRDIIGKPKQMTISRENGKYYVSIMVEMDIDIPKVLVQSEVGIDLGVTSFLTLDNGDKVENPRFIRTYAEHMKKLQQRLARCKKGSNNHLKLKKMISNLHEKIKNKRQLFLHEQSKKLVNEYDRIYLEDLNVKGMTASAKGTAEKHGKNVKQKSGLNKSILDVGFGTFVSMLEYKTNFGGKELIKNDRFYASSKICSCCGYKNTILKLSDRKWVCPECGTEHDRDINSAVNTKVEGKKTLEKVL